MQQIKSSPIIPVDDMKKKPPCDNGGFFAGNYPRGLKALIRRLYVENLKALSHRLSAEVLKALSHRLSADKRITGLLYVIYRR